MEMHKDTPVFLFNTAKEWEEWFHNNHDKSSAIWMKFAKKNTSAVSITYDEALQIALCYGWIDGLINKYDEIYYVTRFTPRKPKSLWSKTNQASVKKLLADGKMQPSGMTTIEIARANGSWENAYDSSAEMKIPEVFLEQLEKDKKAEEFFKTLDRANTYAIGWRLQTAKRPETRIKRMNQLLEMLKRGEKLH